MEHRILIIEDDSVISSELKTLLSGNGYEVEDVTDFTEVVQQTVKSFTPPLILLDIKLPGESGFTICSRIRSFSNVPVIFVTSSGSGTDMDDDSCMRNDCSIFPAKKAAGAAAFSGRTAGGALPDLRGDGEAPAGGRPGILSAS